MTKKRRRMQRVSNVRDAPDTPSTNNVGWLVSDEAWRVLCADGYRPLIQCPEVQICIGVYADLIGSMTLHLMRNGPKGDERVINALSRKVDIDPARDMTRMTLMQHIVRVMLGHGNQVTYPEFSAEGYLDDLVPLPPSSVALVPDGRRYKVRHNGMELSPDEVLHFVLNPDDEQPWRGTGLTICIKDAVKALRQSNATRQKLLESPAPSLVIHVDGLAEEFDSPEGRAKLRRQYLARSESGEPWFVPSEMFKLEQVKPLTLNDLAIRPNMELDKRAIAAAFGIPPFLVGVGEYNKDAYRQFVSTRVMAYAKIIEQELTKKLLYADDMYWRFNPLSLYSYSLDELVKSGSELVDRMTIDRNELRDWIGLTPDARMAELLALENYIPAAMLGQQKKLKGGGDE